MGKSLLLIFFKKLSGGWGKNKVPKINWNHGEKNWEGGREKIKLQKKTQFGAYQGWETAKKKSQPKMA